MPYYLLQLPGGNLAQLFANSPEEARNIAGNRTGVSAGQIIVRDQSASQFTNEFVPGTEPQSPYSSSVAGTLPSSSGFNTQLSGQTPETRFTPEEGLGRAGAFRRALQGRGVDTGTLAGGSLLGQQGEQENVFDVLQLLNRAPGGERAFETFARGSSNPFTHALELVNELGGMNAQNANPRIREFLQPTEDQNFAVPLGLAQAALRGQVGAFGSNPILRGLIGRIPGEFAQQSQAQQSATPFFQFLRQRAGI